MSATFQITVAVQDQYGEWVFLSQITSLTPDVAPDKLTTLTFTIKADSDEVDLLHQGSLIRVFYRRADGYWASPRNATYRLIEETGDRLKDPDISWVGASLFADFDNAVLLQDPNYVPPEEPEEDPPEDDGDPDSVNRHPPRVWPENTSVGLVLSQAILESKARGELAGIDTSAVDVYTDSEGRPWPLDIPEETHHVFTPLSNLVDNLIERKLVSVQFDHTRLLLLRPEDTGVDRSDTVELMPRRDLSEAAYKVRGSKGVNRVYVRGSDAVCEVVDAPGQLPNDIRTISVDAAGVSDPAALRKIGELHLASVNRERIEITVGIDCHASKFVPWRDFAVDDTVTVVYGRGETTTQKISQITVEQTEKHTRASVVLGDRMLDADLLALRELRSMREGSTRALGAVGPYVPYRRPPRIDGGGGGGGGGNVYAVMHGNDPTVPRPPNALLTIWIGSVQPNEQGYGDLVVSPGSMM